MSLTATEQLEALREEIKIFHIAVFGDNRVGVASLSDLRAEVDNMQKQIDVIHFQLKKIEANMDKRNDAQLAFLKSQESRDKQLIAILERLVERDS